jgi:site-specific DNA recombinase
MQDDIRDGRIEALIFSKLARLARSTKDLLDFADFFREHDAHLVSLEEAIDTSSPAGRLFYTIIAAMAQWEREEIADRVKASVVVRATLGKPLGGAAPFGYQWHDGALIPDPNEAPIRRLMYELFKEEKRVKRVARLLNHKGYRTRKGAKFSYTTVKRLLLDPTAKGLRRANYTRSLGENKHWQVKPEDEWIYTEVEAIVSEDLWDECNRILSDRKSPSRTKKTRHLFAGVVRCHCGPKMYVPSGSKKYVCQTCRHKIPTDDLERIFHEELKQIFLSREAIAEHLRKDDEELVHLEGLLASLEK